MKSLLFPKDKALTSVWSCDGVQMDCGPADFSKKMESKDVSH